MKNCCENNIIFKKNVEKLYCKECGELHINYGNGLTKEDFIDKLFTDVNKALIDNIYFKTNVQSSAGERQISFTELELDKIYIGNNKLTIRHWKRYSFLSVQINNDNNKDQFRRTHFKHDDINEYSKKYGNGESIELSINNIKYETINELRKYLIQKLKSPFIRLSTKEEFNTARKHFNQLNTNAINLINLLHIKHK